MLPSSITAEIQWSTLRSAPERVHGVQLRNHTADVVLLAEAKCGAKVVFLIEHKSHPDPDLANQVLRYAVHLRHSDHGKQPPPFVIATVLQHGNPGSTGPVATASTSLPLVAMQPSCPFEIDDLRTADEQAILARALTPQAKLTLLCLRFLPRASADEVSDMLRRWALLLQAIDLQGHRDAIAAFSWYAVAVTEAEPRDLETTLSDILQRQGNQIMSTLERYYNNGVAAGKAEGLAEGKAEGKAEGERKGLTSAITLVLTKRFGPLSESQIARLRTAEPSQLDRWADRILDATSIDAAMAD